MKKIILCLFVTLQAQFVFAQRLGMMPFEKSAEEQSESRPQMTNVRQDSTADNESVKAFLSKLCEAASREDLNSYFNCFENPSPKNRKEAALTFAEHDV